MRIKTKIKVKNLSENELPFFATEGSSGFDLRSNEEQTIESGDYKVIGTGLYFEIPDGFEVQIRSRSGLAAKHGVCVLNSPGTIDSDYTGEIKIILINHGKESFKINKGDRIAQGVLSQSFCSKNLSFEVISELQKETVRNDNGFGSTGVN